jgi:hypothetical protein
MTNWKIDTVKFKHSIQFLIDLQFAVQYIYQIMDSAKYIRHDS